MERDKTSQNWSQEFPKMNCLETSVNNAEFQNTVNGLELPKI